jgi:hypothetical protein
MYIPVIWAAGLDVLYRLEAKGVNITKLTNTRRIRVLRSYGVALVKVHHQNPVDSEKEKKNPPPPRGFYICHAGHSTF